MKNCGGAASHSPFPVSPSCSHWILSKITMRSKLFCKEDSCPHFIVEYFYFSIGVTDYITEKINIKNNHAPEERAQSHPFTIHLPVDEKNIVKLYEDRRNHCFLHNYQPELTHACIYLSRHTVLFIYKKYLIHFVQASRSDVTFLLKKIPTEAAH